MKKILILSSFLLLLMACTNSEKKESMKNTDEQFDAFKTQFIDDLWKIYPGWASSVGYHAYDSVLVVPNEAFHKKELEFSESKLEALKAFDKNTLSAINKTDYGMIENSLLSTEWSINQLKDFEWNPSGWNVGSGFGEILNGSYEPLDKRLVSLYKRMANVKEYYETAKKTIKNPTAEHLDLSIAQNGGSISIFDKDIPDSIQSSSAFSPEEKAKMIAASKECAATLTDFVEWMKAFKNPTPRSFRLGKELYAQKFNFDIQSGYTPEELQQKAIEHKAYLHHEMIRVTTELWGKYFGKKPMPTDSIEAIQMMISKLSLNHAKPEEFQAAIEKQIPELEKFVMDKNLIYLDPKKPLVVRKEPSYMAGVAGASISAPGPYDKEGNTYYNVGSLAGWTPERSESYLREYNTYMLQILNIHEAVPGHYTQLIYSNNSPSLIKSIFGNGAMVEGWAVYTERMMLEEGYGGNSGEMWLMYYKWNLRATCNSILDYSVHAGNMTKEEAVHFLTHDAFQQQAEAEGKWKRCTLTQVQLCSYFNGFSEIYNFREEMKKKLGDKFDLKAFHEKFLSYGSAPVKEIRTLMLQE